MCWDCVRKGPPDYIKRENQYTEAERVLVRCSAVLVCDNSTLTLETSAVAVQSQHAWMCVWGLRCYCGNLGYAVLGMNSGRLTLIDFMVCFGLFSELRLWQFHFASFTFFFSYFHGDSSVLFVNLATVLLLKSGFKSLHLILVHVFCLWSVGSTLCKDLRLYLSKCFTPGSMDSQLQQVIRENLYLRAVPCEWCAPT